MNRFDLTYMKMALEWANLSSANRKKVGCLIIKDRMIISDGYNGTPSGTDNICEDKNGDTHWYVLHAEANALMKLTSSTQSCHGATLYVTFSPCRECSKLIHQSGIKKVVYLEPYKDVSGIQFLKELGVEVVQINLKP